MLNVVTDKPSENLSTQRQKPSALSYLRNNASKSLARFSAALLKLSEKLSDPVTTLSEPSSQEQIVNVNQGIPDRLVELPLPPVLSLNEQDYKHYEAVSSGRYGNITIFPCYVNREASSVIVATSESEHGLMVMPLFVGLTHSMLLADKYGNPMLTELQKNEKSLEAKDYLNKIVRSRKSE